MFLQGYVVTDPLAAIMDRLVRADENLDEIRDALRTHHASDLHKITVEFEPTEEGRVASIGYVLPPPIRVYTLVGDVLHEWRSILDHLAWQLVLANGGKPGDQTSWPVLRLALTPYKRGPTRGKSPPPNVEGGVSDIARAIFDGAQPYQWKHLYMEHPFYLLDHLNIVDKHRHVALQGFHITGMLIAGDGPLPHFTATARTLSSSEYGAEVEFVPSDPKVDVNVTATLQVTLHEIPGRALARPLLQTLEEIRMSVLTTVRRVDETCFGGSQYAPPSQPPIS